MNLGFDIDGVLYPFHEVAYNYCHRDLGMKLTYDEFWYNIINDKFSKVFVDNLVNDPKHYNKFLIDPKILDLLNALSMEHTIYYVTARPKELNFTTRTWFERNKLPQLENLFITNNGDKVKYIVDHKIEVFVEDRDRNALELKDYTKVILVKKLWNESIRDQFLCVDSVLELPSVLENLKGSKVI